MSTTIQLQYLIDKIFQDYEANQSGVTATTTPVENAIREAIETLGVKPSVSQVNDILTANGYSAVVIHEDVITVSGHLQDQIETLTVSSPGAILGDNGLTVTSGIGFTTISGFRDEFVTASGHLQTQISSIDSSVTLQEAYDNGDGTIVASLIKPLDVDRFVLTSGTIDVITNNPTIDSGFTTALTIAADSLGAIQFKDELLATQALIVAEVNTGNFYISPDSGGQIAFFIGSGTLSNTLYLNPTGVGVHTNAPTHDFHVAGSGIFTDALEVSGLFTTVTGIFSQSLTVSGIPVITSLPDYLATDAEVVVVSGHLQDQINTFVGSSVTSVNSLTGNITIAGTGELGVSVDGQNVVVSGTPHNRFNTVKDFVAATGVPPTEAQGDRYILTLSGVSHANWDGAPIGSIVEFNGSTWDYTSPEEGWVTYVANKGLDILYVDGGAPAWKLRPDPAAGLSDGLISGGISWDSGLIFNVTALTYIIGGILYSTSSTQVTLTAADPTNPRIDVIVADDAQVVSVVTGTPAPSPSKPEIAINQVEVSFVTIEAGATTPAGVVVTNLYLENAGTGGGEWDATTTHGTINVASTNSPYQGSLVIEATNPLTAHQLYLDPAGTFNASAVSNLEFAIKVKPGWGNSYIYMSFESPDFTLNGSWKYLAHGLYGFDKTNTSTYQIISIPLSAFNLSNPASVTRLRFFVVQSGGALNGFFLDRIRLQTGIVIIVGGGNDPNAIHKNVANEISSVTAKTALVAGDILIGEDSQTGFSKKKFSVNSLGAFAGTALVTTSGHLQTQIDTIVGSSVISVNDVTGAVLVTGTQNVTTQTVGQTITVTGPDLTSYATTAELVTTSGYLQTQIDDNVSGISDNTSLIVSTSGYLQTQIDAIDVDEADVISLNTLQGALTLDGADGITVTDNALNTITVSGFYTEFVSASGFVQGQVDSLGDTYATVAELTSTSGHLQTQINAINVDEADVSSLNSLQGDLDIEGAGTVFVTTAGSVITVSGTPDGSDIDSINSVSGSLTLAGADGIIVVDNTIDSDNPVLTVSGFRTEFVSASGSLQSQISAINVDEADVSSLNSLQGNLTLEGKGIVSITDNALDTITISGSADEPDVDSITASGITVTGSVTFSGGGGTWLEVDSNANTIIINSQSTTVGGSGNITDINAQTGPSITITGAGTVSTTTGSNVITISGASSDIVAEYTHHQHPAATEWLIEHNLNSSYFSWSVWRSEEEGGLSIQPDAVLPLGVNDAKFFFDPAVSGVAYLSVGKGVGTGATFPAVTSLNTLIDDITIVGKGTSVVSIEGQSIVVSGTDLIESFDIFIETPKVKSYTLEQHAYYPYTINEMTYVTVTGTVTGTLSINSNDVVGLNNRTMNITETTSVATSNSSVVIGDTLRLTVSGLVNVPGDLSLSIKTTRVT